MMELTLNSNYEGETQFLKFLPVEFQIFPPQISDGKAESRLLVLRFAVP